MATYLFKRAGKWMPCTLITTFGALSIIEYVWQDITYQVRIANTSLHKCESLTLEG